ncbi:hypothetical protein [Janthinobacterium sp. CAN_S7]|uniref:hypothetical protein n=1 Tax=Janthinobacterium sp. CAN_S7 TaxID=3071704 RepID=UPI00319DF96D
MLNPLKKLFCIKGDASDLCATQANDSPRALANRAFLQRFIGELPRQPAEKWPAQGHLGWCVLSASDAKVGCRLCDIASFLCQKTTKKACLEIFQAISN